MKYRSSGSPLLSQTENPESQGPKRRLKFHSAIYGFKYVFEVLRGLGFRVFKGPSTYLRFRGFRV